MSGKFRWNHYQFSLPTNWSTYFDIIDRFALTIKWPECMSVAVFTTARFCLISAITEHLWRLATNWGFEAFWSIGPGSGWADMGQSWVWDLRAAPRPGHGPLPAPAPAPRKSLSGEISESHLVWAVISASHIVWAEFNASQLVLVVIRISASHLIWAVNSA